MRIVVDSREPGDIVAALAADGNDIEVEIDVLDVGDYLIGPGAVVERKTGADFVASILDGRMAEQAAKMKAVYDRIVWIIEGSPYDGHVQLDPRLITGAISRLAVVEGAAVVRTDTKTETIDLILSMTKRLQDGQQELTLRPTKPRDPRELAEFIVCGLPRIGRARAQALLERFGSVRGVFTADPAEVADLRGFGRKTAETIRAALDAPY